MSFFNHVVQSCVHDHLIYLKQHKLVIISSGWSFGGRARGGFVMLCLGVKMFDEESIKSQKRVIDSARCLCKKKRGGGGDKPPVSSCELDISSGGSRGGRRGRSPPLKKREGGFFRPSIKHISIHSFAC